MSPNENKVPSAEETNLKDAILKKYVGVEGQELEREYPSSVVVKAMDEYAIEYSRLHLEDLLKFCIENKIVQAPKGELGELYVGLL